MAATDATSLADPVAALVGLLATQAFVVGLLLSRLDARLDSTLTKINNTANRLKAQGSTREDVVAAVQEADDAHDAVDSEMLRSRTGTLALLISLGSFAIWYSGLRAGLEQANPIRWLDDIALRPSQWDPSLSAISLIHWSVVVLFLYGVYRVRVTRRTLNAAYRGRGLHAIRMASAVTVQAARSPITDDPQTQDEQLRQYHDEAVAALAVLAARWPQWQWTAGLHGDYWAAVARDRQLAQLAGVDAVVARRNAWHHYTLAIGQDPDPNPWLLVRRALIDGDQADAAREGGDDERELRFLDRARADLQAAAKDPATAPVAFPALADNVRATLQLPHADDDQRRLEDERHRVFTTAFETLASPSTDLLLEWTAYRAQLLGAPLEEVATRLVRQLQLIASALRSARADSETVDIVSAELRPQDELWPRAEDRGNTLLFWLRAIEPVLDPDFRDRLLPAPLLALVRAEIKPEQLREARRADVPGGDGYVLAQALNVWILEDARRWRRAELSRIAHPIRRRPQRTRVAVRLIQRQLLATWSWAQSVVAAPVAGANRRIWRWVEEHNRWL